MAWEWHNRDRDLRGRFNGYGRLPDQLHIRVTRVEGQKIRDAAWSRGMEIGEFVRNATLYYLEKMGGPAPGPLGRGRAGEEEGYAHRRGRAQGAKSAGEGGAAERNPGPPPT